MLSRTAFAWSGHGATARPVVADIDGDCRPEILVTGCGPSRNSPARDAVIAYTCDTPVSARGVWNYNGAASGDEYADFLLSIPRTKQFGAGPGVMNFKAVYMGAFIADSWKVNPNLTVDVGLRYEAVFQPAAYNLGMVNFWPERYKGVGSLDNAGLVQGGVNGVPLSTVRGDWNNFMPRLGIAWRATDKWVLRGGAGMYFDERTGQVAQGLFSNPPVFTQVTADCGVAGQSCSLSRPDNWTFVNPGYDPKIIPELVRPLLRGECDAVFGSRMLGGRPIEGGMPKWKYWANLFLTMVENAGPRELTCWPIAI